MSRDHKLYPYAADQPTPTTNTRELRCLWGRWRSSTNSTEGASFFTLGIKASIQPNVRQACQKDSVGKGALFKRETIACSVAPASSNYGLHIRGQTLKIENVPKRWRLSEGLETQHYGCVYQLSTAFFAGLYMLLGD